MEWEMLYGPGRQPGWNVKCQKSRALPLPPLPDAGVLHRAGRDRAKKEEAALTIPLRGRDTRELFSNTAFSAGGRWLMIGVTNAAVLEDVKRLIHIRRNIKKKV